MSLTTNTTQLLEALRPWLGTDASFALYFLQDNTQEAELDATCVREAAKLCDRVVVASVTDARHLWPHLKALGADVLHVPQHQQPLCRVVGPVAEVDTTFMLQTILTVMPNVVFVHKKNLAQRRTLQALAQTFGAVVSVREVA